MDQFRRVIWLSVVILLVTLAFNVVGYFFVSRKTSTLKVREAAEQTVRKQQLLLQQALRYADLLLIHQSFDKQQQQAVMQKLHVLERQFEEANAALQSALKRDAILAPANQLHVEAMPAMTQFWQLAATAQRGDVRYASATGVRNSLQAAEKAVVGKLQAMEQQLLTIEVVEEDSLALMQKTMLGSLLLALFFLVVVALLPTVRQSMRSYRQLQHSLAEIRRSENLLRTVINSSPDFIFIQDLHQRFQLVNRAFARAVGKEPADFIGRTPAEMALPANWQEADLFQPGTPLAEINGGPWEEPAASHAVLELSLQDQPHIMAFTSVPLLTAYGAQRGYLRFASELTQRIKMEQELRSSEERYRHLFQNSPLPMWIYDLETLRFLEVNESAVDHYGYTEEEFLAMTIMDIRPLREQARLKTLLVEDKPRDRNNFRGVWTHCKRNGEQIAVQIVSHKINYKGKAGMLILATDVTENIKLHQRIILEKVERQRQIARATIDAGERERNQIGKELHDNVNQILTAAKLNLEFMSNAQADKEKHRLAGIAMVNKAIEEIRRLSKFLVPPSLHDVGLQHSVEELMDSIRTVSRLQLDLVVDGLNENELSPELKLTVYRIIQEQITNILRHSGATEATVRLLRSGSTLHLQVEDNGCGFSMTTLRKGIGLKNIYNRAEIYQGAVHLASSPGRGCTLKVTFRELQKNTKSNTVAPVL